MNMAWMLPQVRASFRAGVRVRSFGSLTLLVHTSAANRLDRLVSGVILVATSTAAARRLGADFGTPGRVQKEYVARVRGEFPIGTDGENGELVCEQPLLTIDKQIGVNVVHPDGRVRGLLPQSVKCRYVIYGSPQRLSSRG